MKHSLNYLLISGSAILAASSLDAADFNWTASSSGPWTTSGNWTLVSGEDDDGIPDADDNILDLSVASIIRPSSTADNNINNFTFSNSSVTGTITPSTNDATATINIGGDLTKSGAANLSLNGVGGTSNRLLVINVAGAMTVSAGRTLLSGVNLTVTGVTTLNGGSLEITPLDISSASTVAAFNGGVVFNSGTSTLFEFNRDTTARTTKVGSLSGGGASTTVRGDDSDAVVVSTLEINGASGSTTFAGLIVDGHANRQSQVIKTGASTQAFTGANTYSGGTVISAGTLLANNTTGSAFGTGAVAVNGGILGGTGFIQGATTITGGGLAAGTDGTVGELTFDGDLDLSGLSGSGQLKFDLAASGASDKVLLSSGTLSIGSGALNFDDFSFNLLAGFGEGVYTLLDTSSSITGTLGSSLSGTIGGMDAVLSSDGQDIFLTVSTAAIPESSSTAAIFGLLAIAGTAARRRRQS